MECSYGCLSNFDLPPPESPSGRNKLTVPAAGIQIAGEGVGYFEAPISGVDPI